MGNLIGVSDDLVDWQGTSVLSWLLIYVSSVVLFLLFVIMILNAIID